MFKGKITDVFFDLDHTLWDFEKNSASTFRKILKDHHVSVQVEDFLEIYVPINFEYWKLFREEKISKEALRYERLKKTFDGIKYTVSDALIYTLSEDYLKVLPTFNVLFPNTIELLDYLKPKYNLHIITNGFQEIQDHKLQNSGIHHYFMEVVNSEMAGVKKPHAKIFELALNNANTTAGTSLMIGDNLEADIFGAQDVGMQVLHFNAHGEQVQENIPTINDWSEINRFL